YFLALIPTFLIAVGLLASFRNTARRPDPAWIMLVSFLCAGALALISQSLKVPSYAQVKAFYLFSGLLPICALAGLGWETLVRGNRILAALLTGALTLWAFNSVSTFWIRPAGAQINILRGMGFLEMARYQDAQNSFQAALQSELQNATARSFLAQALQGQGR